MKYDDSPNAGNPEFVEYKASLTSPLEKLQTRVNICSRCKADCRDAVVQNATEQEPADVGNPTEQEVPPIEQPIAESDAGGESSEGDNERVVVVPTKRKRKSRAKPRIFRQEYPGYNVRVFMINVITVP